MARLQDARQKIEVAPSKTGVMVDVAGQSYERIRAYQTVDVSQPGHAIPVQWAAARGANDVEITAASISLVPQVATQSLGELPITTSGLSRVVTVPGGRAVGKLQLEGLAVRNAGGTFTTLNSGLSQDARLVVSIPDPTAGWLPVYSVPAVGSRGVLPAMFQGASYANKVLTLPGTVASPKLLLSLVKNAFPEDFALQEMKLDRVTGWAAAVPRNLELVGPDGAVIWSQPGDLPLGSGPIEIDLRLPLQAALKDALAKNTSLEAAFTLRADSPSKVGLVTTTARGALLRTFPGVMRVDLQPDASSPDFETRLAQPQLADETPSSATADLTVRYAGLRILESVSAKVPAAAGNVGGIVVTDQPALRGFPPEALLDLPVAKAGLVGRAPEACELAVQLVDYSGGAAGAALGDAGVIELDSSAAISTCWVELPGSPVPAGPVALSVRANKGRFYWACDADPLVRMAIVDPDPGGRALNLNGKQVLGVDQVDEIHIPGKSFTGADFRSRPPVFDSSLFLTVELSDLVLRYQR